MTRHAIVRAMACGLAVTLASLHARAQHTGSEPSSAAPSTTSPAQVVAPEVPTASTPSAESESPDEVVGPPSAPEDSSAPQLPPASEVIADPELASVAPPVSAEASGAEAGADAVRDPSTGDARVVLRSRLGVDTGWDSPRDEVWEATQVALLEATVRRSESLRFVAGVRVRHLSAFREHDTPDAGAARFEFDLAPTAAYGDVTAADGLHVRLGYQLLHLGLFDLFSATDVLSVVDLRSGPATMPEAADIAQAAARADWDASSWLSFTAAYVPFFQPHTVSLFDTDYALVRPAQADIDQLVDDVAALDAALDAGDVARIWREGLSRSARDRFVRGAFSAFAPDPDPTKPQGALRATARGSAGELAVTLASALEHLPALLPSAAWIAATDDPTQANGDALSREPDPLTVEYGRFYVISADGDVEVGPFLLGAEVAYQHDRVYLAAENGRLPLPERTDVVQLGLRAEHVQGGEWLAGVEGFASSAIEAPSRRTARWTFVDARRWRWGGAGLVGFSPGDTGLTLELGGGVVTGPSLLLAPRVELRVVEALYVELGAHFVEGPARGALGDPQATLGGLYDDVDQVFLGVKWLP